MIIIGITCIVLIAIVVVQYLDPKLGFIRDKGEVIWYTWRGKRRYIEL